MGTTYLVCAILGGTLMLCQLVLSLVGLGHHDFDHAGCDIAGHDSLGHGHHGPGYDDHNLWYFNLLSFRTIMAALLFFGLAGLGASVRIPEPPELPPIIASAAGALAVVIVAWLMQSLAKLQSTGNVHIARAVGTPATVYLTIPAGRAGSGKIHVKVQKRLMEYEAVTSQPQDLPTGVNVVVVAVVSPGTVEVASQTSEFSKISEV